MNDLNNSIYPLFVSGSNVMTEELFTNCTRTVGIQFLAGLVSELKHIQLPRIYMGQEFMLQQGFHSKPVGGGNLMAFRPFCTSYFVNCNQRQIISTFNACNLYNVGKYDSIQLPIHFRT